MHQNGIELVYRAGSQWRRVRYRPTSDGWVRETARWNGCRWAVEGSEPVSDLSVDAPDGNAEAIRGP